MWLFVAFVAVPLIEIALFIQVGGFIGLWPTLLIVILTAILGSWLVRSQGLLALGQVKQSFNEVRDPTEPLAHGAMILFSGALLLTPGFFTDSVGFALLIPAVRAAVFRWVKARVKVTSFSTGPDPFRGAGGQGPGRGPGGGRPDVIDGEYEVTEPAPDRPATPRDPLAKPSGWTRPEE